MGGHGVSTMMMMTTQRVLQAAAWPQPRASALSESSVATAPDTKATTKKKKEEKKGPQALAATTAHEDRLKQLASCSLAAVNAGIFLQNISSFTRSSILSQVPQPFSVLGSALNLASCFVPDAFKLPAFVAGTALNMGGSALSNTHVSQADVARTVKEKGTFDTISQKGRWSSYKYFPHTDYIRKDGAGNVVKDANGNPFGYAHMAHGGFLSSLARHQYWETYYDWVDNKKMPSFLASMAAGSKQLGWMVGTMIKDPNFAHDALMPVGRQDFVRSTKTYMPNAPGYLLALGCVLPLAMLAGVSLTQLLPKSHKTKQQEAKADDPYATTASNPVELVANLSSVIPPLANLMFVPAIKKAGFSNPMHIMPPGLNMQHHITPVLNGRMIQAGSVGAIASASVAVLSDVGVLPRYVAYIANILFMASSGLTAVGLSRHVFETEFKVAQLGHLFPMPTQQQHMHQAIEAEMKGWHHWWPNRFPKLPPKL